MSEHVVKFRVKNRQGKVIGYETYRPEFGWWYWLVAETIIENEEEFRNLRQGIINETSYYREMFTGVQDKERVDLYENDELVDENGKTFKIYWHKQPAA